MFLLLPCCQIRALADTLDFGFLWRKSTQKTRLRLWSRYYRALPPLHMEICSFGPSLCISFRGGEVVSELFSMSSIDIPPRSGRLQSSNLSGKGWFTFSALITFCSEHLLSVKAHLNAKQTLMRQVLLSCCKHCRAVTKSTKSLLCYPLIYLFSGASLLASSSTARPMRFRS